MGSELSETLRVHQHRPGTKDMQSDKWIYSKHTWTTNMRSKPPKSGELTRNVELHYSAKMWSYSNRPNSGANQPRWFAKPIFLGRYGHYLSKWQHSFLLWRHWHWNIYLANNIGLLKWQPRLKPTTCLLATAQLACLSICPHSMIIGPSGQR
jgi:hypothetical protein